MLARTVDSRALKITARLQFGMIDTISDVRIVRILDHIYDRHRSVPEIFNHCLNRGRAGITCQNFKSGPI